MFDLVEWIRSRVTGVPEHATEHEDIDKTLADQARRLRVARVDAGLPPDRRQTVSAHNPGRRMTDGH